MTNSEKEEKKIIPEGEKKEEKRVSYALLEGVHELSGRQIEPERQISRLETMKGR